jgi:hypothetical protein
MKDLVVVICAVALTASAPFRNAGQSSGPPKTISARMRATFVDDRGGLGVLSGDMTLAGFDASTGALRTNAKIDGTLADSTGDVLDRVDVTLTLGVTNVVSSCNQLSMDLPALDFTVLQQRVHLDPGAAGFDSRDGGVPKAQPALCRLTSLLLTKPSPAAVATALNDVVTSIGATAR